MKLPAVSAQKSKAKYMYKIMKKTIKGMRLATTKSFPTYEQARKASLRLIRTSRKKEFSWASDKTHGYPMLKNSWLKIKRVANSASG